MKRFLSLVFFEIFVVCVTARNGHHHNSHHALKVFSSLQHNGTTGCDVTLPYPLGAPLTLTCQSPHQNAWEASRGSQDAFEQENSMFHFLHVAYLSISRLTADHDGMGLKCRQQDSHAHKKVTLNVISPPELSVKSLDDGTVECKVTKNWKPDLELCWMRNGNSQCEQKRRISHEIQEGEMGAQISCRARLRERTSLSSLTEEARDYFRDMFDQAEKSFVVKLSDVENPTNVIEGVPTASKKSNAKPATKLSVKLTSGNRDQYVIFLKSEKPSHLPVVTAIVVLAVSFLGLTLLVYSCCKVKEAVSKRGSARGLTNHTVQVKDDGKYRRLKPDSNI